MESIQFGSKTIEYSLTYKERKTLGITVHMDRTVSVTAPLDTPVTQVKEKVRKRAPWIIKQQGYFLSFEPRTPARRYVGGETHLYLGRQYRLKFINSQAQKVLLKGAFLEVHTEDDSKGKELLSTWYQDRARKHFLPLCKKWINIFEKYGVSPQAIKIHSMSNRWGSCTPKGKVILNTELIQAPKRCIEYVIVHELCHLVHHNHSQAFFKLQTSVFSDWKIWKEKLERVMV